MTEFQEKLDKTRAIEGELERTIDGLDPVDSSRVNIAAPDQSLYTTTQEPTTASIAIKTKPGQSLDASEVAASRCSSPTRSTGSSPRT